MREFLPSHPGETLREFLEDYNIPLTVLLKIRVSQILKGKRSITADTALCLSKYFGMSTEYWMNLQTYYDVEAAKVEINSELEAIPVLVEA